MYDASQEKKRVTHNACTSVIVGPAATIDGSVMIARTEDNYCANAPKYMTVIPPRVWIDETFVSANNGFRIQLTGKAWGYTATPEGDPREGLYEESGINGAGVAMSATESTYANDLVLSYDPLVADGIAEDAMVTVVLPFVNTAREGVERLGRIISEQGSAENNSVLFADSNEAWYMEIATGHHWVAQRFAEAEVAVCANRMAIEEIDFESDNFLCSEGIKEFIDDHRLNPDADEYLGEYHFRRIFATASQQDVHYNAPRVWYGQRYLSTPTPEFSLLQEGENPQYLDTAFVFEPGRKITVDDVDFVLSSHYDGTEFDPLSNLGTPVTRKRYRPISLTRTQEGHILQMRPWVRPELAGIHWIAFAATAFTPFVPVMASVTDLPEVYKNPGPEPSHDSAYWIFRMLGVLAEANYPVSARMMDTYLSQCRQKSHAFVARMDEMCKNLPAEEVFYVLTKENNTFLTEIIEDTRAQIGKLLIACAENSELTFSLDENL